MFAFAYTSNQRSCNKTRFKQGYFIAMQQIVLKRVNKIDEFNWIFRQIKKHGAQMIELAIIWNWWSF